MQSNPSPSNDTSAPFSADVDTMALNYSGPDSKLAIPEKPVHDHLGGSDDMSSKLLAAGPDNQTDQQISVAQNSGSEALEESQGTNNAVPDPPVSKKRGLRYSEAHQATYERMRAEDKSDQEIALGLGRTPNAIRIKRKRDLGDFSDAHAAHNHLANSLHRLTIAICSPPATILSTLSCPTLAL